MSRIGGVGGAGLGSLDNPKLLASCRKVSIRFSFFLIAVVQVVQGVRRVTARVVVVPRALGAPACAVQTGDFVSSVSPNRSVHGTAESRMVLGCTLCTSTRWL